MVQSKKASKSIKLSSEQRAELRARLPDLINQASFSEEAAREALQICLRLRIAMPSELFTSENLATVLSASEIVKGLNRLGKSEVYLDISDALMGVRKAAAKQIEMCPDGKFLSNLSRAITSKLLALSSVTGSRKGGKHSSKGAAIRFAPITISSAADLAIWIIGSIGERKIQTRGGLLPLTLRWVRTIYALWRCCPNGAGMNHASRFLRQMRPNVSPSIYASIMEQPEVVSFFKEALSLAIKEAPQALLDGRLNDLESYLSVLRDDENSRSQYFSRLLEVCRSQQGDLLPEAVEWIARRTESDKVQIRPPTAVDESQSYALNYVSLCLLSSWDAALEGQGGVQVLKNVRQMARELFKVDLLGTPGDIVRYNQRDHDLGASKVDSTNQVKITRPGVQWSDGVRTRVLIRALVEPIM